MMWLTFSLAIAVNAAGDCPTQAEVMAELASIRNNESADDPILVARVTPGVDSIDVVVIGNDNLELSRRHVQVEGNCHQRAKAAAVVIASVETQFKPIAMPEPADPKAKSVVPPPPEEGRRFTLSLGAGAQVDSRGIAGLALMDVVWARATQTVVPLLSVRVALPRQSAISEGDVRWWIVAPSIGVREILRRHEIALSLQQELALQLTYARGSGFDTNLSASSATPAMLMGTRMDFAVSNSTSIWMEFDWLLSLANRTFIENADGLQAVAVTLPRHQLILAFGVGF